MSTGPLYLKESWPTINEIASEIPFMDLSKPKKGGAGGNARRGSKPITFDMTAEPFPMREGYFEVTPQQILSLYIPVVGVNGDDNSITGFQRAQATNHIRDIGRALILGDEIPPLTITLDKDDEIAYICDGGHRALAGIAAKQNVMVIVKVRTYKESRALFTNQNRARSLKFDDTIITGTSPVELYVQDALTDANHPWYDLVGLKTAGKMTPTTMATIVGAYVHNTMNQGVRYHISRPPHEFNPQHAHELAFLIKSFGTPKTNPLAFKATTLRTITSVGIYVFRRSTTVRPKHDMDRWQSHMPQFQFHQFAHLLKQREMALAMVAHWNKRLSKDRQVHIQTWN